jgi:cell division protein FtsL
MTKTIPFIVLLCLCYSALFAQVRNSAKKKVAKAKSTANWEKDLKEEYSDLIIRKKMRHISNHLENVLNPEMLLSF